ncbi:AcrR family transcriptional regulator [Caulobacter ginsengisoli]|uniref:AcrR family transcriptional regulator n=1 Tax=Caulobacter ginsengisoli TaxID=400775 RepID=A0ABU0IX52_9CAUL|nr:TetR family transcriptional regulator [Caulobacter ginsengisoli]MDQ0466584.1 AcrR family transcriptional regulator [Caulobacter ginsengisoli]
MKVNFLTAALQIGTKGERVAARIRAAALEQFSRQGFERTTMGEIAREAGVSQAALHYHFQDKAQLWRSAMLDLAAHIAEEERAITAARDARAIDQLRMAMRLFVEISWRHPALGRIVALEGMAGGERLAWLVENLLGDRNRRLAHLAARAIAEGDLKPFPPEQIVVTLQAAAAGLINLQPLMRANFGVLAYSAAGRAAHLDMILAAVFDGFVNRKTEETRP